jgi:hypothetical protein
MRDDCSDCALDSDYENETERLCVVLAAQKVGFSYAG